jgi:microcystin-dependent protein
MPFLSEIRLMAFGTIPKGWAPCDGRQLPVRQYVALFNLLGFTYGGDGHDYFNLPDLRGRVPLHAGAGFSLGQAGGERQHTLQPMEMAAHTHAMMASSAAAATGGAGVKPGPNAVLAQAHVAGGDAAAVQLYGPPPAGPAAMSPQALAPNAGGQAHENRQPFLVLNFCIALQGEYPTRD